MDYKMDSGWRLHPIGGDTGQAYMGIREEEKVFLKRNSSPFLAALSVEGITPRLIWTKRVGNGDVLTAQEWLDGRVLTAKEMQSVEISNILRRIHQSDHLLNMLRKVKGEVYDPETFLEQYQENLSEELNTNTFLSEIETYLTETIIYIKGFQYSVCHGDLNRKNFLLDKNERLYLVDWEMVKISDPFSDLAMLLIQYVDRKDWGTWLEEYGIEATPQTTMCMEWYTLVNGLLLTKRYHQEGKSKKMNQQILLMKETYENRLHTDNE
ncbi:phosphotransferase family protein [Jeotgalibaca sp. MA1X17-3]|uniref:phosphotransferase family protein n=1 Tax=Jeotgalibaca sp. MA1X17-3 TaxID=2908211 RepID=UPI001F45E2C7|nr:phosphotransferase family protein [Jeotgalibaca sp. MA1X17-3]UJF15186.1 phosphotransferase family protein [Jeotgalibaca sp. MA1X17-3]